MPNIPHHHTNRSPNLLLQLGLPFCVCVCVCGVGVGVNYCLFPMLIVCKNHRTPNSYSSLVTLRLSLYSSDCLLLASSNCQCELRLCVRVCVCISTNISNCCCCQNFLCYDVSDVCGGLPAALRCVVYCVLLAIRSYPPDRRLCYDRYRPREVCFYTSRGSGTFCSWTLRKVR